MASPKARPTSQLSFRGASPESCPGWAGPAGSQWGQPGVGSRNREAEDRPSHRPPARAHHVVVDHLLQAVSKPLQTLLGRGRVERTPHLEGTDMPPVASASQATGHRATPAPRA